MAEPADFADSCAAPRTRPLSADEVLGILRRAQRFAEIGEADADELPTHDMTIRRWSQSFDEGGPQGYVRWIFELEEGQEWKRLFAWGTSGTVGDVCRYIAARASIEDLESARVLGVADRKAGAFLLLRRKLAEAGCDVSRLRPSTPLAACPYRGLRAVRAAVLRVAPELLPPLDTVAPRYSAAICSIVLAALSFILGMALLVAPWSVAPCFVLSLLALTGAVRAAMTGHRTRVCRSW